MSLSTMTTSTMVVPSDSWPSDIIAIFVFVSIFYECTRKDLANDTVLRIYSIIKQAIYDYLHLFLEWESDFINGLYIRHEVLVIVIIGNENPEITYL